MILHYPGPLFTETDTGEKKRPKKMLIAFQDLGYDVILLAGHYQDRYSQYQKIKNNIKEFAFIYSENSNLPLSTTGTSRFPNFRSVDFQIFKLAKEASVPRGVFIRDIFWLLKETVNDKSILKRMLGKFLFEQEIRHYYKNSSAIFVPSDVFKSYLPESNFKNFHLLPPGAEKIEFEKKSPNGPIKIIYVGSCKPPVYQVLNGFQSILKAPNIHLTIVTRPNEHEHLRSVLGQDLPNFNILSASDQPLSKILQSQDIGLACIDQNEYWDLAMPLKIFDYIGHQLPILTYQNGETANLVKKNNLGWAIENVKALVSTLNNITITDILQKSISVKNYQNQNTWLERAKTVAKFLQK